VLRKRERTEAASEIAVSVAEGKAHQALQRATAQSSQSAIRQMRKPAWFEKFFWFISSENYIVIGGRDAHQNELIVKREWEWCVCVCVKGGAALTTHAPPKGYLRKGDIYVHADLHGATSCVIKQKIPSVGDVPPSTLSQAGMFSICRSAAWSAKIVTLSVTPLNCRRSATHFTSPPQLCVVGVRSPSLQGSADRRVPDDGLVYDSRKEELSAAVSIGVAWLRRHEQDSESRSRSHLAHSSSSSQNASRHGLWNHVSAARVVDCGACW
jgi:hypothetical protein